MAQTGNRKRRRRLWVLGLMSLVVLAWTVYKVTSTRVRPAPMAADDSCQTDPATVADMSRFAPGAAPIRCQPWDIGTGVSGYVWRAPNPRAVLLLQPGYGDYAHRYVKQNNQLIPHLLHLGVSVYAFDMWGTGRSPGKRGVTDVGQAVEDHLAARRKLGEQPLPVFLFGHSMGGTVTATSAVRDQSRVSGMILLAPALDDVNAFLRFVAKAGGFLMPTLAMPIPAGKISAQSRDPEAQERMEHDSLLFMGPISWVSAASWATISHQNWERYPEVRVPVLAIHGTADPVANPGGCRQLIEMIASQDKTIYFVEGALHGPLDDTARDETRQMILTWLERRLPANRE